MRLAKYLAACGEGSRRACEAVISAGRVSVNGAVAISPAIDVDPQKDVVLIDGRRAEPRAKVYYAVNKPTGYTSSRDDKHAEFLVTELVPADPPVWPAGRLDRETSGLIVLTNDGDLTQRLTHPSFEKEKEYMLTTDSAFTLDQLGEARAGVVLDDGDFAPDLIEPAGGGAYRIVVHEGRKRLIRRFAAYFGKGVRRLERVRISRLTLQGIEPGEYRKLSKDEANSLIC
jgi:pseudouridine synthase